MTAAAASSPNARLVQAVQMRRRKVDGLAGDDVWRPYLFRLTGIESLRQMNGRQLGMVLDDLTRQEAPTPGRVKKPNRWKNACPQAKMVLTLWLELFDKGLVRSRHDKAIDAFVKRQTGVDSVQWLTDPADAAKVIEALKSWRRRPARSTDQDEGVGDE
jgi:hypothetical protein